MVNVEFLALLVGWRRRQHPNLVLWRENGGLDAFNASVTRVCDGVNRCLVCDSRDSPDDGMRLVHRLTEDGAATARKCRIHFLTQWWNCFVGLFFYFAEVI